VRRDETAISSADAQEVTVTKRTMRSATAPPFPSNILAEYAAASHAEIFAVVGALGYVGKRGLSVRATAGSPSVVVKPNGMANQARPQEYMLEWRS
jgi:hypothetical protein